MVYSEAFRNGFVNTYLVCMFTLVKTIPGHIMYNLMLVPTKNIADLINKATLILRPYVLANPMGGWLY